MARGRKAVNGAPETTATTNSAPDTPDSSTSARAALSLASVTGAAADRDVIKVNNANLTELKNACDDALKRFLARPDLFQQIHTHTDVRLALGWAGVFVAAGTAFYGYKVEFEESKPVMWVGLIVYMVLTTLQALYAYFIEGEIIFVGKRKTFDKRILTERITIFSRTTPASSPSPSPSQLPFPLSLFTSSSTKPVSTSSKSAPAHAPPKPTVTNSPSYTLNLSYIRTSSAGKSLLSKQNTLDSREYARFFDEEGVLDQEAFEAWVGGLVGALM